MACLLIRFIAEWKEAYSSQIKANIETLAEKYLKADELSAFWKGIKS